MFMSLICHIGSREQNAQESSTLNVRSGKSECYQMISQLGLCTDGFLGLGKQRATQAVDEEGDLDCNSSDNDEQGEFAPDAVLLL